MIRSFLLDLAFALVALAGVHAGCGGGDDGADDSGQDTDVSPADTPAGDDAAPGEPQACDPTRHEGQATYYTFADGSGNCMFPATPDDLNVAAMNHPEYEGSYACGGCVTLSGPLGTVTVRIVDRCPECGEGHLDLSPSAFEQVAQLEQGRVPIQWNYVPCDVQGPIRYHFKEGSNQWWTAVQVRNHRHRIAAFEVLDETGAFNEVGRVDYNFFVKDDGMGPGPYTFRVTDEYGQVLVDSGIPHVEGGEVEGAAQFPSCQ